MSNCKNKFLGLDSIDVLMKYINMKVAENGGDARVCTIQVYKYFRNTENPNEDRPSRNIYYDFEENIIKFPIDNVGWGTLDVVAGSLAEDALSHGAIWMSTRIQQGATDSPDTWTEWSKPIKISGVNGKDGIEFRFSYNEYDDPNYASSKPLPVSEENQYLYFWVKDENGEWPQTKGDLWMQWTKDGRNGTQIHYQYAVTSDDSDGNPIRPDDNSQWFDDLVNISISQYNPNLWMRSQITEVGLEPSAWVGPILFSKYGKDGNVPNYSVIIYKKGKDSDIPGTTPGIFAPDVPTFNPEDPDNKDLNAFLEYNSDWSLVPTEGDTIWWQCAIRVNGQLSLITNGTEEEPFVITRYNAITQEAIPGQFTKYLYRWSPNFEQPEFDVENLEDGWKPADWEETPDLTIPDGPTNNLWMTSALINGFTDAGLPDLASDWSNPIRLTGPRGPIAFDYRIERRYNIGNAERPADLPNKVEWHKLEDNANKLLTKENPYVWAADYLVRHSMKYTLDDDGNYIVDDLTGEYLVEPILDAEGNEVYSLITSYGYYRISGLNGEDGNTKNHLTYSSNMMTIRIKSFVENNLFVANSAADVTYELDFDKLTFIDGYTAKFTNIGSANMIIKVGSSFKFVSGENKVSQITVEPQETIELVTYNDGNDRVFLVLGKAI